MKRKTLIRAAALALTAALLFTGCTARTLEKNPESSGSSQNSMAEPEKAASSGTKAAAVAVAGKCSVHHSHAGRTPLPL